jgi:Zn-dependent peptidase ImmA (M78 family)
LTFQDIAVLVTHIHRDYFKLDESTEIPIKIISSDNDDLSYHAYITAAVVAMGITSVEIMRLDYRQQFILGRFHRYADEAEVWISNNLNTCWSRYIAAKELSHLLVDKSTDAMTTNVNRTLDWVLKMDMNTNIHDSLDSEHIAAQFAIELLVPYHLSKEFLDDDGMSSYEIAAHFSVPERIIDAIRLPKYAMMREEAYKDI